MSDLVAEKGSQIRGESWHGEHQLFRLWYALPSVDDGHSTDRQYK